MKKLYLILLISLLVLPLMASDRSEVWSRLYRQSTTIEQKVSVMQKMVLLDDPALETIMTFALDELINGEMLKYANGPERNSWEALTRMAMTELAQFQAEDAAYLLMQIVNDHSGIIKADALMALGDMKAIDYAPEIAILLRHLNYNQNPDKDAAEIEAYSAVYALGKMKALEGFEPVFYAHVGWYSRRTKKLAGDVLSEMLEDPSDQIMEIMVNADYKNKLIALEVELDSDAPVEGKTKVIVEALRQSVELYSTSLKEKGDLYQFKIKTLTSYFQWGVKDIDSLKYLVRAYRESDRLEEKILIVQAVGINGSDEAVQVMSDWLNVFHEKKLSGLNPNNDEITLITQLIYGLEISQNELAKPVLSEIEIYDYSNKINRAAAAALKNIP